MPATCSRPARRPAAHSAFRHPARQRIAALVPEATKWKIFMKIQAGREQYLKAGDVVEARIATADGAIDLGVQRNRIVDAT